MCKTATMYRTYAQFLIVPLRTFVTSHLCNAMWRDIYGPDQERRARGFWACTNAKILGLLSSTNKGWHKFVQSNIYVRYVQNAEVRHSIPLMCNWLFTSECVITVTTTSKQITAKKSAIWRWRRVRVTGTTSGRSNLRKTNERWRW